MSVIARISRTAWFGQMWADRQQRFAVLADYATIGAQHRHFLADVALRGQLYTPFLAANDREAAIMEGRRELALEIIKLAKGDHDQIFGLIPKPPREEKST